MTKPLYSCLPVLGGRRGCDHTILVKRRLSVTHRTYRSGTRHSLGVCRNYLTFRHGRRKGLYMVAPTKGDETVGSVGRLVPVDARPKPSPIRDGVGRIGRRQRMAPGDVVAAPGPRGSALRFPRCAPSAGQSPRSGRVCCRGLRPNGTGWGLTLSGIRSGTSPGARAADSYSIDVTVLLMRHPFSSGRLRFSRCAEKGCRVTGRRCKPFDVASSQFPAAPASR